METTGIVTSEAHSLENNISDFVCSSGRNSFNQSKIFVRGRPLSTSTGFSGYLLPSEALEVNGSSWQGMRYGGGGSDQVGTTLFSSLCFAGFWGNSKIKNQVITSDIWGSIYHELALRSVSSSPKPHFLKVASLTLFSSKGGQDRSSDGSEVKWRR